MYPCIFAMRLDMLIRAEIWNVEPEFFQLYKLSDYGLVL